MVKPPSNKISIIGAGSACFSLSLIRDVCLTPSLAGSTVSFMDVDAERLETVHALACRYAGEVGIALQLESTTSRRESLQGADFVINTALAIGNRHLYDGIKVAREHGYRFGGSFHVMHDEPFWANYGQFKLFDAVTEDILDICPDAYHLLVANPVLAGITRLARRYPQARVVGLCHGYRGISHLLSALGIDWDGLTYEIPGVNHFIWLTHAYYRGEDVFLLLDRWIEQEAAGYWKNCQTSSEMGPKAIDLYKRFGVFPVGDTCTPGGGTWPWWYHSDAETEKRWLEDPDSWWEGHFARVIEAPDSSKQLAGDESIRLTDEFPGEMSGESMIPLIKSIACDVPGVHIVNVQNKGDYVPGIPPDFEVEVPAVVSRRGIQPIQTNGLPDAVLARALHDRVAPVNVELAAYDAGSKELLLQLVMMDPWTRSEEQARALLDAILALPGNEEMREHYR
jgi:alpha-galactosidase